MTYMCSEDTCSKADELLDEINRMEREISAYREALEECLDWFKPRYDGEYFPDSPSGIGNDEMKLGTMVEEILGKTFKSAIQQAIEDFFAELKGETEK